jgi:hypothetical protein
MIKLRTGKEVHANHDLASITYDDKDGWQLYEGYDGSISIEEYDFDKNSYVPAYTTDELLELATIMLNKWYAFSFAVANGKVPVIDKRSDI